MIPRKRFAGRLAIVLGLVGALALADQTQLHVVSLHALYTFQFVGMATPQSATAPQLATEEHLAVLTDIYSNDQRKAMRMRASIVQEEDHWVIYFTSLELPPGLDPADLILLILLTAASSISLASRRISLGLIRCAVKVLPIAHQQRYREELGAELARLPRLELGYSLRQLGGCWQLRRSLSEQTLTYENDRP